MQKNRARPISRILAGTVISLGRRSPSASSDLPGDGAGHAMVPLRDLAAGRACPFHPAFAGSSLWRWSSPHGGRVLPASLPCAVRTFLDGSRRRDRLACSGDEVSLIATRFSNTRLACLSCTYIVIRVTEVRPRPIADHDSPLGPV